MWREFARWHARLTSCAPVAGRSSSSPAVRWPPDWEFFTQPAGCVEVKDEEGNILDYKINPQAENRHNLTPEYYKKVIQGKSKDWIDVYVMNRLGTISEGKAVYHQYNDETHRAKEPLRVMPGRTIWVGLDFGFYPAAVFAQLASGTAVAKFSIATSEKSRRTS